jgi:type III secretion system (T3SS) SseB-like protein
MAAVAENRSEATMGRLFEALGASRLLVPVKGGTGAAVALAVVVDSHGTTFHAFSDEQALLAALGPGAPYVTMEAPALAAVALSDPAGTLVVDAGRPAAGRLSRRDLELVRDRLVPGEAGSARAQSGGSLRLFGLSGAPSDTLLDALAAAAASQPGLASLHLFEGSLGEGDRHAMVGARFAAETSEDEQRTALAAMSSAARPHVARGELIDVIALSDELVDPVTALGRPIWPRRT